MSAGARRDPGSRSSPGTGTSPASPATLRQRNYDHATSNAVGDHVTDAEHDGICRLGSNSNGNGNDGDGDGEGGGDEDDGDGDGDGDSGDGWGFSGDANNAAFKMEESFVVLPSSISRTPGEVAGVGLDARFAALARIFDMASDEARVDHPVCLECAAQLREELDARVKETEAECDTYRDCLRDLGEEPGDGPGDDAGQRSGRGLGSLLDADNDDGEEEAAFAAEVARCECEEAAETARGAALEVELEALRGERRRAESTGRELDAREVTYWDDFNDFKLALRNHVEERDGLVVNIEQTARQLERLRRTNVFNDAFHIWFDGPFGTVNGFRLGRLPSVAVEWDEINAAWGMACLLLSTMAQSPGVNLTFRTYTLQPLGSFSKVLDARGTAYELYGPVNILSSHKYDRAMVGFLSCLREFAEFATERDVENGVDPAFELPYKIDGDKIDGRKIAFPFNRYERWTAALKIMLTDLKTCLAWLSNNR